MSFFSKKSETRKRKRFKYLREILSTDWTDEDVGVHLDNRGFEGWELIKITDMKEGQHLFWKRDASEDYDKHMAELERLNGDASKYENTYPGIGNW